MTESRCTCMATRPLGSDHMRPCPLAKDNVVQIYRNPETGRPIAVPDEVVTAAEREYRAYMAHIRGKTWTEVAAAEHYDSPEAAAAAVKRYLDEGRAVVQDFSRREVVAAHVGRLMAMRDAFWDAAVEEKKTSALMGLLAIEDRWVKAFGLDVPDAEDTGVQTVVVAHDDYIKSLQEADRDPDAEPEADAG